jgi:hypothetical protein
MAGERCWIEKRDADGQAIPGCWMTPEGYTVSLCRLRKTPYTVARDGDRAPFAYLGSEAEVVRMIAADQQAQAQRLAEEGACA